MASTVTLRNNFFSDKEEMKMAEKKKKNIFCKMHC